MTYKDIVKLESMICKLNKKQKLVAGGKARSLEKKLIKSKGPNACYRSLEEVISHLWTLGSWCVK